MQTASHSYLFFAHIFILVFVFLFVIIVVAVVVVARRVIIVVVGTVVWSVQLHYAIRWLIRAACSRGGCAKLQHAGISLI